MSWRPWPGIENAVECLWSETLSNQKQQKLADAKDYGHGQTRLSIIFYREFEETTENPVVLSQEKASFAFSVPSSHKPSIAWHIRQIQWWSSWNVRKMCWIASAAAILVNQKVPVRFVISSKRQSCLHLLAPSFGRHLEDTWIVIKSTRRILDSGGSGVVTACTPNYAMMTKESLINVFLWQCVSMMSGHREHRF